jgi:hypothetical protein
MENSCYKNRPLLFLIQSSLTHWHTVCSPSEKSWLECGVVGDVMLCDRDISSSKSFDAIIHSEKGLSSQQSYFLDFLSSSGQMPG